MAKRHAKWKPDHTSKGKRGKKTEEAQKGGKRIGPAQGGSGGGKKTKKSRKKIKKRCVKDGVRKKSPERSYSKWGAYFFHSEKKEAPEKKESKKTEVQNGD